MFFVSENKVALLNDNNANQTINSYWEFVKYLIHSFDCCYINVSSVIDSLNEWNIRIQPNKDELDDIQYYADYHGYSSSKLIDILSRERKVKEFVTIPARKVAGFGIETDSFLLIDDAATLFSLIYSSSRFEFSDLYSGDVNFNFLVDFYEFMSSMSGKLMSYEYEELSIQECFNRFKYKKSLANISPDISSIFNEIEHESLNLCSFYLMANYPNWDDDYQLSVFRK